MKKALFISVLLSAIITGFAFAQTKEYKYPFQESEISYRNVNVYKILDHKDAYIVMYAKGHRDVGNVTIPKSWYSESPKKVSFRQLPKGMSPFMTVINRNGAFERVILTMPLSKGNSYWGVADSNIQVDAEKDTLDIEY